MENAADTSRLFEVKCKNAFPIGMMAYTAFAILVTVIDLTLTFFGPIDLQERIVPFTGWSASGPYMWTIFFAVWYCMKREPKALHAIAFLLLMQICLGIIEALKPAREDFGNPWLMVSPWRPVWTIAIPTLWLAFIIHTLRLKHPTEILPSKRLLTIWAVLLAGLIGLQLYRISLEKDYKTGSAPLTKVGQAIPGFTVATLGGNEVNISDQKGKVVLINFWATWCGPCRMEMPRLEEEIWRKFKSSEFVLLTIAHGESNEEVSAFRDQSGYSFPMAPDPDGKIFHFFAHDGIPRNYVVGRDGTILYQSVGYKAEEFDKMKRVIEEEIKMARKASERDTR